MSRLVRSTTALLLIAGCGGAQPPHGQEIRLPHAPDAATAATTTPQTATTAAAAPLTIETRQAPAAPAPAPADGAWKDCGLIRSPVDRRPQHVQARVFDCRAARRVAVKYLRNGALPRGWQPADCAASRAACEQGGWAFRVMKK